MTAHRLLLTCRIVAVISQVKLYWYYLSNNDNNRICYFADGVVQETGLPERFTFPFYYKPHPLAIVAAGELQHYLETHTELDHNFGLEGDATEGAMGKMFGVLVVRDAQGRVGHLWAVSGKLANSNDHAKLVPPVFDMLREDGFFLAEQDVISAVNTELETLLNDADYNGLRLDLERYTEQCAAEIAALKQELKVNKGVRAEKRAENEKDRDTEHYAVAEAALSKESHYDRHRLRELKAVWKGRIDEAQQRLAPLEERVAALRNEQRERSGALQERLFEQYTFLNQAGDRKSLQAIFSTTAFGRPPSGAGECATPKLLQYAFMHGYQPLAMAEFWWGAATSEEVRQHKQFYPACAGKCKPILAHMLEGIAMDENPFLRPTPESCGLEIIYEDESLLVVNKSAGLRSIPGVHIEDSVHSRLRIILGNTEPFMVHRLDMGTSGLLLVAKSAEVHKHLQWQFLNRKVNKRYTALLSKAISGREGEIDLPLCPDLFDRPRQMVCFTTGKKSITKWKVVAMTDGRTRVYFWPLTGRTHQIRMHAAHEQGLNAPIVGDDLYGNADKRLYLHAAGIEFTHPVTNKVMSFEVAEDF